MSKGSFSYVVVVSRDVGTVTASLLGLDGGVCYSWAVAEDSLTEKYGSEELLVETMIRELLLDRMKRVYDMHVEKMYDSYYRNWDAAYIVKVVQKGSYDGSL